jgi:hypothetical protein
LVVTRSSERNGSIGVLRGRKRGSSGNVYNVLKEKRNEVEYWLYSFAENKICSPECKENRRKLQRVEHDKDLRGMVHRELVIAKSNRNVN